MSATTGTFTSRTISASAAVLSSSGQLTRTMSTPANSARRICAIVAAASLVNVLVMVCTVIGASPPTGTRPTWIWRDLRRWNLLVGAVVHANGLLGLGKDIGSTPGWVKESEGQGSALDPLGPEAPDPHSLEGNGEA